MKNPLISIIIPNYNGSRYLESCINSAINQDYENFEIIIIDDGSSDKSAEILRKYESQIQVIYCQHQGAAQSRNEGIQKSSGTFIALLDNDDIWLPNKLSKQMAIMFSDSADFVYCAYEKFGASKGVVRPNKNIKGNVQMYFRKHPAINFIGSCSGVVFKKSILEQAGLFDLDFKGVAEDWDFFRRYSKFGKFTFSEDVLYKYRKHENSLTSKNGKEYYLANKLAVLKLIQSEEEKLFISNRILWARLHLLFVKSFLSQQCYGLAFEVFLKSFQRIQ